MVLSPSVGPEVLRETRRFDKRRRRCALQTPNDPSPLAAQAALADDATAAADVGAKIGF
jgi:hypothetical protein